MSTQRLADNSRCVPHVVGSRLVLLLARGVGERQIDHTFLRCVTSDNCEIPFLYCVLSELFGQNRCCVSRARNEHRTRCHAIESVNRVYRMAELFLQKIEQYRALFVYMVRVGKNSCRFIYHYIAVTGEQDRDLLIGVGHGVRYQWCWLRHNRLLSPCPHQPVAPHYER